jgi:hypothetical protein
MMPQFVKRQGKLMTANVMCARQQGAWQFSLKSLLFMTMIVAVCAALVHISIALAVVFIPLIVAGLFRTIRVVVRFDATAARKAAPGQFATFCRSISLIVAMIGISAATLFLAGVAAMLIAVMIGIHVCRATGVIYHPIFSRARRGLFGLAKWCGRAFSQIKPVAIVRWSQAHAVAGTLSLFALCRRLSCQWWCCQPSRASVSTHHSGEAN